jgi:hypothetical protein
MTTQSGRIIPALLIAAGLPAIILTIQLALQQLPAYRLDPVLGLTQSTAAISVFFVVAAVPTLALGLPVFLLLNAFDKVRWWTALPAGMLIGLITFQVLSYLSFGSWGLDDFQYGGDMLFCLMGCFSAGGAWLIWRMPWRRQDDKRPS